ncbi:hypothetical protein VaNZ11_002283 [Volvox africanus]|uniref:BZIP domain-containing protein n=1 Tax=Volvox africanus TaxID=51714 RepID=A0ABQ5RSI8_9CHLO|nr:hypothetical protein VaNZ11_002283 [Volvox africanus]
MQMAQGIGMLGGSTGDDDALESFLDSYLTNGFGTSGNTSFGMGMQQQQPQQVSQQLLGAGLAGQPQLHGSILRPASVGQTPMPGPVQSMSGMGFSNIDDTGNMSISTLQALLRQRQLQQQQTGFGGAAAAPFGNASGMVGMGGTGNAGLMRPTSLQDHLSGGISSEHNVWRPTLGALPSTTGMQSFGASHGIHFGGEQLPGFQESALPNLLAPAPTLRPASDSLLVNQKTAISTPINLQGHGQSSLRTNSLSAQTAAAGAAAVASGGGMLGGSKKSMWDVTTTPVLEGSDDSSEDDSSQRRRVKGRSGSANQSSVQQEKNRSAQRRFRQRQKEKMAYLESRTEVLNVQVEKLTQENDSLRNMNTMLEKVLNLREEHISNLQEAAKVFSNLNLRGDADGSGSEETGMGTDTAAKTVQDGMTMGAAGGGDSGAIVKTEDGTSSASIGMMDTLMTTAIPVGLLTRNGHTLPTNMDGATRFTAEAIRSMSSDEVIEAWKEYLKELSRYVVLAENIPPGQPVPAPVLSRITSITASMSELVHKVAMISPLNVKRLLATNMDLHAMVPVPESHWARVLLVLGLSERQRRDLLGARERFLSKFEAIVQERTALMGNLTQQAIPRSRVFADICSASLTAHEAADRLRANLQREHNINMEFVVFVFKGVLEMLQIAKAAVHSYPYYPDVLAMSNVLHAQQPQSQQPQQSHSQSSLLSQSNTQPQPMQRQSPNRQHQAQQQQQVFLMKPSSQQPGPSVATGSIGGLCGTGTEPIGAGVLYGARVSPNPNMSAGLPGTGSGSLGGSGVAGGAVGPAGSGGSSSAGGAGGGSGMGGLMGLGGCAGGMAPMGMGPMGMGLGGMSLGLGSLTSVGSTAGSGTAALMGFQQQQVQQQHQQQSQLQQQMLQLHTQEDSRMMDG